MFYHFSNVIQNTISLGRNVTQSLGCLTYWLDHWAETWFSPFLTRMYASHENKIQKDFMRLRDLFFPILRKCFSHPAIKKDCFLYIPHPMYLVLFLYGHRTCTRPSHEMVSLLFCSKHMGYCLSGNNSPALYPRFFCDPKRVSQISERFSFMVQSLVIHLQCF